MHGTAHNTLNNDTPFFVRRNYGGRSKGLGVKPSKFILEMEKVIEHGRSPKEYIFQAYMRRLSATDGKRSTKGLRPNPSGFFSAKKVFCSFLAETQKK
jgi:hypothetical protein